MNHHKIIIEHIVSKLLNEPDKWTFKTYTIEHDSGLSIWVGEYPIHSLHVYQPVNYGFNLIERYKISKAITKCKQKKILSKLIKP